MKHPITVDLHEMEPVFQAIDSFEQTRQLPQSPNPRLLTDLGGVLNALDEISKTVAARRQSVITLRSSLKRQGAMS